MSSIRCSSSDADAWMVLANSVCFGVRFESRLSASNRQQQQRVERGAQLVAHVRQELRLVLVGQRELRLLLDAAPCRVDLHVLELDVAVLLGELQRLLQLGVRALQLGGLVLQFRGQPLGLREQLLGAPAGLDGREGHADRGDQPLQEGQVQRRERRGRTELDHPQRLALEQDGSTTIAPAAAVPVPERTSR